MGEGDGRGAETRSASAFVARSDWRIPFAIALVLTPLFLFGVVFTFAGPHMTLAKHARQVAWLIWVLSPLTGLVAWLAIRRLVNRPILLRVVPRGLMWSGFSDEIVPWDSMREIQVVKTRGKKLICVDLIDPSLYQRSDAAYDQAESANRLSGLGDMTISAKGTDRSFRQIFSGIRRHADPRLFGR